MKTLYALVLISNPTNLICTAKNKYDLLRRVHTLKIYLRDKYQSKYQMEKWTWVDKNTIKREHINWKQKKGENYENTYEQR